MQAKVSVWQTEKKHVNVINGDRTVLFASFSGLKYTCGTIKWTTVGSFMARKLKNAPNRLFAVEIANFCEGGGGLVRRGRKGSGSSAT